jgi:hypothetical protein
VIACLTQMSSAGALSDTETEGSQVNKSSEFLPCLFCRPQLCSSKRSNFSCEIQQSITKGLTHLFFMKVELPLMHFTTPLQ